MIIVHVHRTYWPVLGGAERAMQKICEGLVSLGHEVHVVTSTYGVRDRPRYEEVNGVHIHRIKAWTLYFSDLTVPKEIPRELLKRADIVHGWSQNSYFTYRICKEAKKLGKPIVMYFLGVDYLQRHYNPLIRLFGYPYQRLITYKVVEITDLALVTNEYERELLKRRYGIDAVILPHGIDEMYLELPNVAEYFRKKYGIEGKIVAYIGRIHPTKGLDLLIKAFAKVAKQIPEAVLVITGEGDKKYLYKCLRLARKLGIEHRVKYVGYIPEKDKIALIDASDVIVMPTKHAGESYPLLIDEVIARGKLIIVTSAGHYTRRVSRIGLCKLVAPDLNALADALRSILCNNTKGVQNQPAKQQILCWRDVAMVLSSYYNSLYHP